MQSLNLKYVNEKYKQNISAKMKEKWASIEYKEKMQAIHSDAQYKEVLSKKAKERCVGENLERLRNQARKYKKYIVNMIYITEFGLLIYKK